MTGFEPGSSGIVGDRSANCATTTSLTYFTLPSFSLGMTAENQSGLCRI